MIKSKVEKRQKH